MPIKVACHCGQSFTAKDELAGQTLLCPKCHDPLTIPSPNAKPQQVRKTDNPLEDLFDEVGLKEYRGPRCPQCNSPLKPNAVLCTNCGYHLQTGQKLQGAKVYKSGERGHTEASEDLLERAAKQLEIDKVEQKKNIASGLPAWVYFVALAGLTGFVATMFMIPKEQAFLITGGCIVAFAGLMSTYYGIRMIIVAFMEHVACGLLYLFLPFYSLYYLVTRWDRVGGFFLMQLAYGVVMFVGWCMILLAPMMAEEKKETSWRPMTNVEVRMTKEIRMTNHEREPVT